MQRYVLFAGDEYYPAGGWDDFRGSFDSVEEAVAEALATKRIYDWWHVVDLVENDIVMDDWVYRRQARQKD